MEADVTSSTMAGALWTSARQGYLFSKTAPCRFHIYGRQSRHRSVYRVFCCAQSDSKESSPSKIVDLKDETQQQSNTRPLKTKEECDGVVAYPTEKEDEDGGFFPVREPGDFPSAEVLRIREVEGKKEFDPLRDGPLRYLGYANELGEAFAAWLPPGGVPFSYAVAVAYVLADTRDKGSKAYTEAQEELSRNGGVDDGTVNIGRLTSFLAVERAIDTVVWQLLASVIIPGFTIHQVVAFVHFILQSGLHLNEPDQMAPAVIASISTVAAAVHSDTDVVTGLVDKSVPTFCGLFTIPFIVHPIDATVHAILNVSMRPSLRKLLCDAGQGSNAGLKICDETCMKSDFPVLSDENSLVDAFTMSFDDE